jgi:hypothetical protein
MSTQAKLWAVSVAMAVFAAGPSLAADGLSKDLTSTIALLGLPCGQVVSAKRLGDNDYLATCTDKNRYRVYVNAKGRVVAEKR